MSSDMIKIIFQMQNTKFYMHNGRYKSKMAAKYRNFGHFFTKKMIKIENILCKCPIKTDQNVFCTDILHLNNY
jgi:hypothetical protein